MVIMREGLRPNPVLIRAGVLVGLTVALVSVGFLSPRLQQPGLLLIALAALALLPLAAWRPEYGVLALVLTAAFVRFSVSTGTESYIVASLVVTAMLIAIRIFKMLVVEKKIELKPASTNKPLLGFVIVCLISYVWGNAFRDPLVTVWSTWPFVQLGALAVMVLLPGAFLLAANGLADIRELKLLCGMMIFIGIMGIVANLTDLYLSDFLNVNARGTFSFLNTGGLFSLWFVSLTYAQALFNKRLSPWLRLGLLSLTAIWLYIYFIVRVTWLSGWVPPLIAMATISLLRSKRLFLLFLIVMGVYLGLNWDYYTGVVLQESGESGHSRLEAWGHNWQVTGKHFLFGVGPAGYAAYYMSYFPGEAMATHSNYIDVLSQTGIVGMFCWLWFLAALLKTGLRLRWNVKNHFDFTTGFAGAALGGAVGTIVATGLGDWMLPFVYTQTIAGFDYAVYGWVLLGGMVALANICQQE